MREDIIRSSLKELRSKLPMEIHKFYELIKKRIGCEAVFNTTNDYHYLEISPNVALELYDKRILSMFCGEQGEEVHEVELSKVLVANYRMLNRLRQESYILYYEIPRI
jgi:hypothetical protein